jgi:nicotinamide riboside transporter PnuC
VLVSKVSSFKIGGHIMEIILEWIATILGLIGAFLVARKNRWGFMSWIIGNTLWIYFSFHNCHWGMLTQFCIFLILAVYGWVNWKPEKQEEFETNYG